MNEIEDRLRDAFAHRAEHTVIHKRVQGSPPASLAVIEWDAEAGGRPVSQGSGGSRRGVLAVAAAMVAVVVGVGIVALVRNDPSSVPGDQPPTPTLPFLSVDISDPTAVSLDALNGSGFLLDRTYLALDREQIPEGVTIDREGGALIANGDLYSDSGRVDDAFTYTYSVSLVLDDGSTFWIQTVDDTDNSLNLTPDCGEHSLVEPIEIGRIVATIGNELCLYLDDSVISMVPIDTSEDFDPDMAVGRDVFEQLPFVELDEIPVGDPASGFGRDEPADVAFAGTLSGVRWSASVAPGALRTMFTYVAGKEQGGFENDRSSQPDDATVTAVEGSIDAIPGVGTILYGYAPPSATHVIVTTNDRQFARLPLRRRELESYFAVPVPDSITVTDLTFVATDGSTVADVDVPPLPKGLGGSYGGLLTTTRNKPPQPNNTDRDTRDDTDAVDRNDVPIDAVTPETDPAQVTLPSASTAPAAQCRSCPSDPDILGTLDIPAIGLSVPLGDAIDDYSIRTQPGLDPAGASIGDPGVAVIRGNRTIYGAPFFCLDTLMPGDTVNVTTDNGDYRFSVTGTEIVPHDAPLPETTESTLLLTANHPKYTAREQIRVTAILVTTPIIDDRPVIDDRPAIVHSSCTND